MVTMDTDTNIQRASFIGRCLEVQGSFAFAAPPEILGAVKHHCGDLYGAMLTRLDSDPVTRDVWGVPRCQDVTW